MKQQRKLVLHFDLNKTIILADAQYPNQSKEECVRNHEYIVTRNISSICLGQIGIKR